MEFDVKAAGLKVAEQTTISILEEVVKPFAKDYIKNNDVIWDDAVLPFIDEIIDALKVLAQKIDGQ